jgi:hypothetical protein
VNWATLSKNPEALRQFIRGHTSGIVETALDPALPESERRKRWAELYQFFSQALKTPTRQIDE